MLQWLQRNQGGRKLPKIKVTVDEYITLTISEVKPWTGRTCPDDEQYMSRREFLDFARWLKYHVSEDEFPVEPKEILTMCHRFTIDRNEKRRNLWKDIKGMRAGELYQNLSILLINYNGEHCAAPRHDRESLFEIPVYYEEDLCTAFMLHGLEEECAKDFAAMTAAGYYKYYCKEKDEENQLSCISRELHNFCCAAGGLPNRRMLTKVFPEQYERFRRETEQEESA